MRYCVVDTEIGSFGLCWSREGLRRVLLPDVSRDAVVARLLRVADPAEPAQLPKHLTEAIVAYGAGEAVDFTETVLDFAGVPEFNRRVYAHVRRIGWGETTTYGEVAVQLGDPRLARAVGQAMAKNPVPLIVPCHRVLASGGRAGGFSAPGGTASKLRMLALEGVRLLEPPTQLAFAF